MNKVFIIFLKLVRWLTFDRDMKISRNKNDQSITFTGKNDWPEVIVKRLFFATAFFLIANKFLDSPDSALRLLGGLILIPVVSVVFSVFYLKHPNLQKTRIVFMPDRLVYNHTDYLGT